MRCTHWYLILLLEQRGPGARDISCYKDVALENAVSWRSGMLGHSSPLQYSQPSSKDALTLNQALFWQLGQRTGQRPSPAEQLHKTSWTQYTQHPFLPHWVSLLDLHLTFPCRNTIKSTSKSSEALCRRQHIWLLLPFFPTKKPQILLKYGINFFKNCINAWKIDSSGNIYVAVDNHQSWWICILCSLSKQCTFLPASYLSLQWLMFFQTVI